VYYHVGYNNQLLATLFSDYSYSLFGYKLKKKEKKNKFTFCASCSAKLLCRDSAMQQKSPITISRKP
jgi:hypothetical protein